MKGVEREIITAEIYNTVPLLDHYFEKTRQDPFFIDNGYKIYTLEPHEVSFSRQTLKTKIEAAIPVEQYLESVFSKEELRQFKVKNNDPRHLVLHYYKREKKVRRIRNLQQLFFIRFLLQVYIFSNFRNVVKN